MDEHETENFLSQFLLEQGVPVEHLPLNIKLSKKDLIPLLEGYKNDDPNKIFNIYVCNSGHEICCQDSTWIFSKWNARVVGEKVLFFKGEWVFDVSQIPIFNNTLFVVSALTKRNKLAYERSDFVCFSRTKQKLVRKFNSN